MLARSLPLVAIAVLLAMQGQSLAQSRTDWVCWAENKSQCPADWQGSNVEHLPCGSGGHSGFNPPWVCDHICGTPVGPHCKITGGPGGDGGQCGYRAARVDCYN
jgi:hypothetical protein